MGPILFRRPVSFVPLAVLTLYGEPSGTFQFKNCRHPNFAKLKNFVITERQEDDMVERLAACQRLWPGPPATQDGSSVHSGSSVERWLPDLRNAKNAKVAKSGRSCLFEIEWFVISNWNVILVTRRHPAGGDRAG
jgi:hypothetical protein